MGHADDEGSVRLHERDDAPVGLESARRINTPAIVAFVLQSNGAAAGPQAFGAATTVPISSVATGRAPQPAAQAAAAPAGGRGQAPAGGRGGRGAAGGDGDGGGAPAGRGAAAPRGLTVSGEVKNFTPVTDAMLRNPIAGDWLMVRRNYQGWSYSPLNEITRANVKDLKLAWVWSMNDGARQPADAARAQRHHLSHEPVQHRPGARRAKPAS